ncbi:MAG: hypothetical protein ACYC28_14685 [Longimicrobiales bacterium]
MRTAVTHVRDVLLTGLAWAIVWAPVAVLIGLTIIDPDNSMDEMWVVVGAYPGFLAGVLFRIALLTAGDERLDGASLVRAGTLGAVSGLLVGTVPFLIGESSTGMPEWMLASIVIGSFTVAGALSAVGSVLIARLVARRGSMRAAGG